MTTRTPHELAVEEMLNELIQRIAEDKYGFATPGGRPYDPDPKIEVLRVKILEALRAQKPVDVEKLYRTEFDTQDMTFMNGYNKAIDDTVNKYNLTEKE